MFNLLNIRCSFQLSKFFFGVFCYSFNWTVVVQTTEQHFYIPSVCFVVPLIEQRSFIQMNNYCSIPIEQHFFSLRILLFKHLNNTFYLWCSIPIEHQHFSFVWFLFACLNDWCSLKCSAPFFFCFPFYFLFMAWSTLLSSRQ